MGVLSELLFFLRPTLIMFYPAPVVRVGCIGSSE